MASESHSHPMSTLGMATSLIPLGFLLLFFGLWPGVLEGVEYRVQINWVPAIGIDLLFRVDGLALLFGFIITAIGFFVTLYSAAYMAGMAFLNRFYLYLHAFMFAMIGLVCADNLMVLFVFWELTTIFSYLLIGFNHEEEASRANARQALLITGAGGLALLIAILMIGNICNSYEISEVIRHHEKIKQHPRYAVILVLVLAGAFTKSAQFPFHFWLPNAMAAPTPISAFLHSATMVKAGIYLLARLHPVLGGTTAWMSTLVIIGGITALIGSLHAVRQSDLKKVLAYTTVMALGILVMFLGGKTTPSLTAAMTFLLVHSIYKSGLFLVVGIIDHQTGTRLLEDLGGLLRKMPFTAFAATTAALSMAGFPLFFGFVGKEIMYEGAMAETMFPGFATGAALFSNALMTAVSGILIIKLFLGTEKKTPLPPKEATLVMWVGPVVLGFLGNFFGIIPDWVVRSLIQPAVSAFHTTESHMEIHLFHGFSPPLILSMVTLSMGVLFYLQMPRIVRLLTRIFTAIPLKAIQLYSGTMAGIALIAGTQTRFLQNGSLHRYLSIIIISVIAAVGIPILAQSDRLITSPLIITFQPTILIAIIIAAATISVVITRSRLLAICGLGVVGAGVALLFLTFGAPDVALTQLLVETLTVIIVSIILLKLPRLRTCRNKTAREKLTSTVVAVSMGALMTCLILLVNQIPLDRTVTAFFEANSYLVAHGRNIVNVILVDFRGLDTLGEITVVAIAGLTGYALIRNKEDA